MEHVASLWEGMQIPALLPQSGPGSVPRPRALRVSLAAARAASIDITKDRYIFTQCAQCARLRLCASPRADTARARGTRRRDARAPPTQPLGSDAAARRARARGGGGVSSAPSRWRTSPQRGTTRRRPCAGAVGAGRAAQSPRSCPRRCRRPAALTPQSRGSCSAVARHTQARWV